MRPIGPLAVRHGKCAQAVDAQRTHHFAEVDAQLGPVRQVVEQLRQNRAEVCPHVKIGLLQNRAVIRRECRVAGQRLAAFAVQSREDALDLCRLRPDNQLSADTAHVHLPVAFRVAHCGEVDPANLRLADVAIRLLPATLESRQGSAEGDTFSAGIEQQQQRRFLTGILPRHHGQSDGAAGHRLERLKIDRQFLLNPGQYVCLEAVDQLFAERLELGAVPKLPGCAVLKMFFRAGVVWGGHYQHGFSRQ